MVASVGMNRKLLVFPIDEVPEMTRGKGVILQRFKDGGLADVTVYSAEAGLSWKAGAGVRAPRRTCPTGLANALAQARCRRPVSRGRHALPDQPVC